MKYCSSEHYHEEQKAPQRTLRSMPATFRVCGSDAICYKSPLFLQQTFRGCVVFINRPVVQFRCEGSELVLRLTLLIIFRKRVSEYTLDMMTSEFILTLKTEQPGYGFVRHNCYLHVCSWKSLWHCPKRLILHEPRRSQ